MPSTAELATRYWEFTLANRPSYASLVGRHELDEEIEDPSEAARDRFARELRSLSREVAAADPSDDPVSHGLLDYMISADLAEAETHVLVWPVDPNIGIHSETLRYAAQTKALEPEHARALARRYGRIPTMLAQALERHRRQAAGGMTPAEVAVSRTIDQIDAYLGSTMETDPFIGLSLPEGWDGADSWRSRMEATVVDRIRPAYADYRQGLVDEILPRSRGAHEVGIVHLDSGEDTYRRLVERFVTVPADPSEIHDFGDAHARQTLVSEYAAAGEEALGVSDHRELFERLRTDPALRYTSADEMLADARRAVNRAWEAIDGWLGARPDRICEVQPVPDSLAKDMPPAFYMAPAPDGSRPGVYFLNTYQPETRDRFMAETTAFHEAIPGHHFDRALASSLEGLPEFRRFSFVNVHAEGWGLYSERLADEMGLYSGPLDRIGMLTADSWRAARLVVDTGMHYHGWTRDQAVQYLVEWTPLARPTIEQEVDRYIGWPGQALSYKTGQVEISRLRRQAQQELGDRFDIVGFHDAVLTSGSVTLPILAELVERWVREVKGGEGGI